MSELKVSSHEATESFSWHIIAYEENGNLVISFDTTAPFEAGAPPASLGHIKVYSGEFPANPAEQADHYYNDTSPSPWKTGLPWRKGWHIAWLGGSADQQWHYIVKIVT